MRTYIDGQLLDPPVTNLGAALRAAGTGGRLVIEVLADGRPAPEDHLSEPPLDNPYASELRLKTTEAGPLVQVVALETAAFLRTLPEIQAEAARLLHTGQVQEAMKRLGEVFKQWEAAHRAAGLIQQALPHAFGGESDPWPGIQACLGRVKAALVAQDWSDLSDLLEFDLAELASQCSEHLDHLSDRLGRVD